MQQDTYTTMSPLPSSSRFQLYQTAKHHVTKGRYITSNDARGYIPVFEYPLNGQWIMMDIDDGYVLWTGIWKALGNSKADIVKMVDSHPELASVIRRVRGGYLKIQGTWMPYEVALRLARRVAWPIREDLIPLFGPSFPDSCLSPDQPGYGKLLPTSGNRRRARRAPQTMQSPPDSPSSSKTYGRLSSHHAASYQAGRPPQTLSGPASHRVISSACVPSSASLPPSPRQGKHYRYSPYATPPLDMHHRRASVSSVVSASFSVPSTPLSVASLPPPQRQKIYTMPADNDIQLPPLRASYPTGPACALPSISSLDAHRTACLQDPAAVLRRLTDSGDDLPSSPALSQQSSRTLPPSLRLAMPAPAPSTPSTISPQSPETPHSMSQLVPLAMLREKARAVDVSREADLYRFSRSGPESDSVHHLPLRPW